MLVYEGYHSYHCPHRGANLTIPVALFFGRGPSPSMGTAVADYFQRSRHARVSASNLIQLRDVSSVTNSIAPHKNDSRVIRIACVFPVRHVALTLYLYRPKKV